MIVSSHPIELPAKSQRSFGLDLARSTAIILVLVSHFAKSHERLGFWGVELFFALSGYLIGQILWRGFAAAESWTPRHLANFWARRWWRTLPNYYLFLLVSLVFHHVMMGHGPSLLHFSRHLCFSQDLFAHDGSFFGVSWSLCVEEWFYLLFPLLLYGCGKVVRGKAPAFLGAIILILVFSFSFRIWLLGQGANANLRMITVGRLDSIACGVLFAFVTSILSPSRKMLIVLCLIGLVGLSSVWFWSVANEENYLKLLACPILLVVVPACAAALLPLLALWSYPSSGYGTLGGMVEKLSLWSYSIYLSHIPVLFTVYHLMGAMRETGLGNLTSKIVGLIVTVMVSALLFRYFELPLLRKRPPELNG